MTNLDEKTVIYNMYSMSKLLPASSLWESEKNIEGEISEDRAVLGVSCAGLPPTCRTDGHRPQDTVLSLS